MSTSSQSLSTLVQNIVPESRRDQKLREELIALCQDVLSSHIGRSHEPDISHVTELIKRHLLQQTQSSSTVLKFTNLLSRLLEQRVLSKTPAVVQFLHAVSSSNASSSQTPVFLPSLAPPRTSRPTTASSTIAEVSANAKKPTGKTKAEILRKYRAKIGQPHLSEEALIRDALYILQGISGKYVKLVEGENGDNDRQLVFVDDAQYIISNPNRTLIHRLAELGHLYTRIESFVKAREYRDEVGMIEQSLCHHLESQLTEYYRLIAVLESQVQFTARRKDESEEARAVGEEMGLTLKRLEVWVDDWRLRLRMMSACVEGCKDVHGGALVNLIHGYTANGDPFVRKFTDELLEEVSKPFFSMLHKWLFSGELYDPFSEFFVALDPELAHLQYIQPAGLGGGGLLGDDVDELSGEREGGLRLWESKYTFREEMLPTFVGEEFGRKIFSTGKSLNFIRYSCHDSEWITTRESLGTTRDTLQYSDLAGLKQSIDAAYSIASRRLFDVFFEKFKLLDHFKALKNYLFLGHGDFADYLMESLAPGLSRPANVLHRHNLTAAIEAAIRSTNAQNDSPDVLRRVDAEMLNYSHGEIGWDVFTLRYKVDAPIDTVLDPDTMINYFKVFQHLWKLKRIEGSLSTGWMRIAGGARTFLRVPELEIEWHQVRLALAEMIHFVRQVQAYCQLEVIECQWKGLMEFINKKEGDLDALIAVHNKYASEVSKKILLHSTKSRNEDDLIRIVQEMFDIILQFRTATDDFYNYTLAEASRIDSLKDQSRGLFTDHRTERDRAASRDTLPRILQRTRSYQAEFSEKAQSLVLHLSTHEDGDCKYLGIRLSFSDFYKTRKEVHSKVH